MPPRKKVIVTQQQEDETLTTPKQQRELLVYRHGETAPEWLATGITTDHGLMDTYGYVCGQESDAWLLRMLDQLPDWWPLVDTVEARNLSNFPDLSDSPEEDAQLRLEGLSPHDRAMLKQGWRVMNTAGGGRIFRLRNTTPIVQDIQVIAILDKMSPKVLGPFEHYMDEAPAAA